MAKVATSMMGPMVRLAVRRPSAVEIIWRGQGAMLDLGLDHARLFGGPASRESRRPEPGNGGNPAARFPGSRALRQQSWQIKARHSVCRRSLIIGVMRLFSPVWTLPLTTPARPSLLWTPQLLSGFPASLWLV